MSNKFKKGDILVLDGDFEVRVVAVILDYEEDEDSWWYEVEPTDPELLATLPPRWRTREVREKELKRAKEEQR